MSEHVFLSINYDFIAEQILEAERTVFLAIPGLTSRVSDALIKCSEKLGGWDSITVSARQHGALTNHADAIFFSDPFDSCLNSAWHSSDHGISSSSSSG